MTKKHFNAIAEALRSEKPGTNWNPNKRVQWELDVKAVARALAQTNPRFCFVKFYDHVTKEGK